MNMRSAEREAKAVDAEQFSCHFVTDRQTDRQTDGATGLLFFCPTSECGATV